MLETGLTTRALTGKTVSEAAGFMSRSGFRTTELCLCLNNLTGYGETDISALPSCDDVKAAVSEFSFRGVSVAALGMYCDLSDGSSCDIAKKYIEYAAASGVKYISTGCGSRGICEESYENDYKALRASLKEICTEAEKSGVYVALKPCVTTTIASPRRMKSLIEDLEAETGVRLGAVLSPGELIDATDEEGMFYYLKNDVAYVLGSDRLFNTTENRPAGEGSVDWARFMVGYIKYADKRSVILENVKADNCAAVKHRIEEYYDEAFRTLLTRMR